MSKFTEALGGSKPAMPDAVKSPEAWEQKEIKEVSTQVMDELVKFMAEAKDKYDEINAQAKEANRIYEERRAKLLEYLNATGKKKYHVAGLGLVSVVNRKSIKMPEDLADREKLLDFVREYDGLRSITVNYQTLNRIYKENAIKAEEQGQVFEMPGAGVPEVQQTISFRKEK